CRRSRGSRVRRKAASAALYSGLRLAGMTDTVRAALDPRQLPPREEDAVSEVEASRDPNAKRQTEGQTGRIAERIGSVLRGLGHVVHTGPAVAQGDCEPARYGWRDRGRVGSLRTSPGLPARHVARLPRI